MEHHNDLMAHARQYEQEDKLEEAAVEYEKIVAGNPLDEIAIQRLLVIYRKLKQYRKEMQLLNASIKANTAKAKEMQNTWSKKHPKAARASRSLLQSLSGKKLTAAPAYEEKMITTWRKRKENLAKKMKKS